MTDAAMATLSKVKTKDARSSVTGSNMKAMITEAIASLPADEQKQCDAVKLLQFIALDGAGLCCHTAEDVEAEIGSRGDEMKAKIAEDKIGSAGFVPALLAIAEKTD